MDLANIIFELDGTRTLIGPAIRHICREISGEERAHGLDGLDAAFRESYDMEGWEKTVLMRGAKPALHETADGGYRMFLFTNKPRGATTRVLCQYSAAPPYSSIAEWLRYPMALDGASAATSIVIGDTREEFEAAPEVGVPAAIPATGYGRLPHVAPRPPYLSGELDELGPIFARAGGVA